jgi:hypothetical protein
MSQTKYTVLPISEPQIPEPVKVRKSQIRGMYKLGRVVLFDENWASFRSVRPEENINRMIDYMYEDDRSAIMILLRIFSVMPRFLINAAMNLIIRGSNWKGMPGAPFRMLQIGLKGLIFTLYYADTTVDKRIHKQINWDAKISG